MTSYTKIAEGTRIPRRSGTDSSVCPDCGGSSWHRTVSPGLPELADGDAWVCALCTDAAVEKTKLAVRGRAFSHTRKLHLKAYSVVDFANRAICPMCCGRDLVPSVSVNADKSVSFSVTCLCCEHTIENDPLTAALAGFAHASDLASSHPTRLGVDTLARVLFLYGIEEYNTMIPNPVVIQRLLGCTGGAGLGALVTAARAALER